jgi:hypothetical protein
MPRYRRSTSLAAAGQPESAARISIPAEDPQVALVALTAQRWPKRVGND